MKKTVVILQSNYIPWKGYFDLINIADEFIFLDDVQYTVRDWRNRNRIKTETGLKWLTIPIGNKRDKDINKVYFSDDRWKHKHLQQLKLSYMQAPYFRDTMDLIDDIYKNPTNSLSEFNQFAIAKIAAGLGIKTEFKDSSTFHAKGKSTERLIDILIKTGATHYLSGPAGRGYINSTLFEKAGIELEYFDYSGYLEYPQLFPPFVHEVTILDLIFNTGPKAIQYFKSFKP
ncbi:MAG: WbqC family protein [Sporocytophaga sp.]|nr:WbqC family protein [Sporocytophaga sp.]